MKLLCTVWLCALLEFFDGVILALARLLATGRFILYECIIFRESRMYADLRKADIVNHSEMADRPAGHQILRNGNRY